MKQNNCSYFLHYRYINIIIFDQHIEDTHFNLQFVVYILCNMGNIYILEYLPKR